MVGLIQYDFWTTRRVCQNLAAALLGGLGEAPNIFFGWVFRVSFFRKDEDLINLINLFQFEIRNLSTYGKHISSLEQIFNPISFKHKVVVVLVVNHNIVQRCAEIFGKTS